MNLYQYHSSPKVLHGHNERRTHVPEFLMNDIRKGTLNKSQLAKITKSPELSLMVAQERGTTFPEGEKAIATNPQTAMKYAKYILHDPFPKGEKAIASDKYTAVEYAVAILRGPFPEGEKIILTDMYTSLQYAQLAIQDRWPKGEKIINTEWTRTPYNRLLKIKGYDKKYWLTPKEGER